MTHLEKTCQALGSFIAPPEALIKSLPQGANPSPPFKTNAFRGGFADCRAPWSAAISEAM
jgi:hypothetical protein